MPLAVEGPRIEPPVSLPSPTTPYAAAMAAPVPPEDPDGERMGSCGFRICPPSELCAAPEANSDRLIFARMIAPAARSFLITNASSGGTEPSSSSGAAGGGHVRGIEVVLQDDRNTVERRARPLALALGVERARRLERLGIHADHGAKLRSTPVVRLDARQAHLHELFGSEGAGAEGGVDVGNGRRIELDDLARGDRRQGGNEQPGDERQQESRSLHGSVY